MAEKVLFLFLSIPVQTYRFHFDDFRPATKM